MITIEADSKAHFRASEIQLRGESAPAPRGRLNCLCLRAKGPTTLRVRLADHHGIVRRGLRAFIEEAGLSVVAKAAGGLEAVRLAEEHRPELMIVDIGMPG